MSQVNRRFLRTFTTSSIREDAALETTTSSRPPLDPALVSTRKQERQLLATGVQPIGSRRRRAALKTTSNIPFEALPYQCFQEARKVLLSDRQEKLQQIAVERERIARVQARDPAELGREHVKKGKLVAMQKHLEHLKILADINDPMVKKRFEDGEGIPVSLSYPTTPTQEPPKY
jgi:large subunit ribosomal protein L35